MMITDFRNDETKVQEVSDEVFIDVIGTFANEQGEALCIETWGEGEYGYAADSRWGEDTEGSRILVQGANSRRPEVIKWLVYWRALYEKLFQEYSRENLRERQRRLAEFEASRIDGDASLEQSNNAISTSLSDIVDVIAENNIADVELKTELGGVVSDSTINRYQDKSNVIK